MTLKEFITQKILTNRKGLFFLGARPYMGKTSFAVGIACEIAKDYPVAYVTLEMSKEEWIKRAKHYQYERVGANALKILDYLYSNAEVYLDRKYDKAIAYLNSNV